MLRTNATNSLFACLAVAILALPLSAAPASASSPTQDQNRLDDEVNQHLQTTPESGLIPVIVEGAANATAADRVHLRQGIRGIGGIGLRPCEPNSLPATGR